jgi:hypothetical protein
MNSGMMWRSVEARWILLTLLSSSVGVIALIRIALRSIIADCVTLLGRTIVETQPHVVVGSSWGGAMAVYVMLAGYWRGPTLLLAPAQTRVSQVSGWPCDAAKFHDIIHGTSSSPSSNSTTTVATVSPTDGGLPIPVHVVHGSLDRLIPMDHSRAFFTQPYSLNNGNGRATTNGSPSPSITLKIVEDRHPLSKWSATTEFRHLVHTLALKSHLFLKSTTASITKPTNTTLSPSRL